MQERHLLALIERVREGKLRRRRLIDYLVALGISAPVANLLLIQRGIGQAAAPIPYWPTKRGGGGTLKLLWWDSPTHLNPHLAGGRKDQEASRIFYEPLAAREQEGNLVPILAAEIPTRENGAIAADFKSMIWKLKRGVTWHDGAPFSADDVVFTARYAGDPATSAATFGAFREIRVEKVDMHTVRVSSAEPRALLVTYLVGIGGWILPRHVFEPFIGARSREAPANVKAVGTGPYKPVEFRPGDLLRAEANPNYHVPNQPYFDALELKGGGDAVSAARAVLQTGEYDFAWGLPAEEELLKRLEAAGKGKVVFLESGDTVFMSLNASDPWTEVEGERAHMKSRHPAFSDKAVRTAMGLLVDRKGIVEVLYGRGGTATANIVNSLPRLRSPNTKYEFNVDKANDVLEAAGWKKGADGIRAKGGTKLKFVFQAPVAPTSQKIQAVVEAACTRAGIEIELKAVTSAVFFDSDLANPDTFQKFWADLQMYAVAPGFDPQGYLLQFRSDEIAQKSNKWSGLNRNRWSHAEYDALHDALKRELDPARRAALAIRLNDLVVNDGYVIPLLYRAQLKAIANKLEPVLSVWDSDLGMLGYWTRRP